MPQSKFLATQTPTHAPLVTLLPERTSRNCHLRRQEDRDIGSAPEVTETQVEWVGEKLRPQWHLIEPIQLVQTYCLLLNISLYLSYLIYELMKKIGRTWKGNFSLVQEGGLGSLSVSYISQLFGFFTKSVLYYCNFKKSNASFKKKSALAQVTLLVFASLLQKQMPAVLWGPGWA